jgi:MYXO-CTERM domain-containing protein
VTVTADPNASIGEVPFTLRAAAADGTVVPVEGSIAVIDSDFTISVDKPSTSVGTGGTTDIWVSTYPLFGPKETLVFSAVHVPRGIRAIVEPRLAGVGESVRVRLQGEGIDLAGIGTVRVDAAGKLASHSATIRIRSLVLPSVNLILPLPRANVKGTIPVSAEAAPSAGTTLAAMDLFVDGTRHLGFDRSIIASHQPTLMWDTNTVNDGPHLVAVRATDADGNTGMSDGVALWIQNNNECGCSSDAGGWEALALFGLLAAVRRRKR